MLSGFEEYLLDLCPVDGPHRGQLFYAASLEQNILARELILWIIFNVAARRYAKAVFKDCRGLRVEQVVDLGAGPHVVGSFAVLVGIVGQGTISILGRIETAFGRSHVTQHVIQDFASHRGKNRILRELECVHVN